MPQIDYISKARLKETAALRVKKLRRRAGLFLVEGATLLREALDAGWEVERVVINVKKHDSTDVVDAVARIDAKATPLFLARENDIKRLSETVSPAAVVAVLRTPQRRLEDFEGADELRLAVAGAIQDPGNIGAIIRSADAFALNGVVLSKGCAEWQNPKVIRSTAGSCFHIPIVSDAETVRTMDWLQANNVAAFAAVSRGGRDVSEIRPPRRWAVILGNETAGPPAEAVERCDQRISIQMPGRAESLNVAVSAGIIFHALAVGASRHNNSSDRH